MKISVLLIALLLFAGQAVANPIVFERGWPILKVGENAVTQSTSGAPVNVNTDRFPLLGDDYAAPEIKQNGDGITLVYATDQGRLEDCWEVFPALGEQAWKRRLRYTNTTTETQDVLGMRMMTAPILAEDPLLWNPRTFWMGALTADRALCLSFLSASDTYSIETGADGRVGHRVQVQWRLKPGATAEVGVQGVWLGASGTEAFREEAWRWYGAMGLQTAPAPDWLRSAILYQCNAGGHIDSRFSDVGGFRNFAKQLPYLSELGVDAVWLQSVYSHKRLPNPTKGGWNLYAPLDFEVIDEIMGGDDGLRDLMNAFHAEDIHVLGESVPHGYVSKQAEALPQWWTRKRDGALSNNWGGRGMDYSSPEWQTVIATSMERLAQEFGMEGCRIDVADGSGANWGSPRTPHASYSTLGGALELQAAINKAMTIGNTPPVLIPESIERPEYYRYSCLGYGWDTTNLMSQTIPQHLDDPAGMMRLLRDHFERERGSLPPDALVIRSLNNHDTVCHSGRPVERYGVGLQRALYGVCLMTPGVPMLYQEEEVGSFDALKRLHEARRIIPEFHGDDAVYHGVYFSPEIFCVLRRTGSSYAIGLVNLSGKRIEGEVFCDLPEITALEGSVYDAVSGRRAVMQAGRFPWKLEAYEVAMIRLINEPRYPKAAAGCQCLLHEPTPPERTEGLLRHGAMEVSWTLPPNMALQEKGYAAKFDPATVEVPQLLIKGAQRWMLSGRTALLQDKVQPRHLPFPVETGYVWQPKDRWGYSPNHLYHGQCPSDRLWQSLLEPLHPDAPTIVFLDAHDQAIVLEEIHSTAENIVLSMQRDATGAETGALLLTFYPDDPAIHPRVKALGMHQPWQAGKIAPPSPGEQKLTFVLHSDSNAFEKCRVKRLPYRPGGCRLRVDAPEFTRFSNAYWLIQAGMLRWENLAPVEGRYRLRFELRHSERSAEDREMEDQYEVMLDGKVLALEWGKHNTFNTGNAYYGHALTPPIDLSGQPHTLSIRTKRSWCAIREGITLVAAE